MQLTFRHSLRSSRRFVFENIMDLEHVCVVHRRWFQNLRVRAQRAEYVEYRLTSLFFGLRQEVLARGGPVDADHYWYEFISTVARMRVDGTLEGADGNLIQTEIITFNFSAVLAPLMWLLRPLFVRQKQDILAADTALLEREYALDQSGFRRSESQASRVVVYGGNGFFGRIVVEELLKNTTAHIEIASRTARALKHPAVRNRVQLVESDLRDPTSVQRAITGADLVIVTAGPFQGMPLTVLQVCIAEGISYIDVADDRDFVSRAYALAESKPIPNGMVVLVGCSVVPGLTSILTRFAQSTVPRVVETKICISPGTRHPRGPGSFACLLSTVGEQFTAPVAGREKPVLGWTEPERVSFPGFMGERTCYRVVDIADHFIQPRYFGTETVEFRIGSELKLLNLLLSAVRRGRGILKVPVNSLIPAARALIYIAAPFGSRAGGVMIEVSGYAGQVPRSETWCVFSSDAGERIPSILAAIAAELILGKQIRGTGIVSLPDWITRDRFMAELAARGIQIAVRSGDGEWRPAADAGS